MLNICIPKEVLEGESRVSIIPETVVKLTKAGAKVFVETNAGFASAFTDKMYEEAGATVEATADALYAKADVIMKVQPPTDEEISKFKKGSMYISFLWALSSPDLVEKLKKAGVTALGMEAVPRTTLAQKMDALSSMSSIAGYKAALLAADHLGKYMPMMMTAAGTIAPSKTLILGAGVAGLQAIATCKRLGSVVEAFDVRPAVKEQVESLGAKFVDVPLDEADTETKGGYAKELSKEAQQKQRDVMAKHIAKSDIVITTALIPGKKAPVLVTKDMVDNMQPGSVIVDLAAEQGGNCELTQPGINTLTDNGVLIVGPKNVPALLPFHASQMFSRNVHALFEYVVDAETMKLKENWDDEIISKSVITHNGEVTSVLLKGAEA